MHDTPPVPNPPFLATSQPQLMYVPMWLTVQSGPLPPMPLAQPAPPALFFQAPPAPMLVPPATPPAAMPVPPVAPLQYFGYPPGGWGLMPNYYLAPAQPYLIGYPPGPWPPYQQHYVGLHGQIKEDSEMAKPDKFTGRDPL